MPTRTYLSPIFLLFTRLFLFALPSSSTITSSLDAVLPSSGWESGRNHEGLVGSVGSTRSMVAEGHSVGDVAVNSSLVLAAKRTHRRDPLNGFEFYNDGWNISDRHYWASVGFTAAPFFVASAVWFTAFGACLSIICLCHFCCAREPYGYSRVAYALSLILLILFTIAAMRLTLIIIAAVMLLLTFLGFLFSIFGMQFLVYTLVLFGWILVTGTFILSGTFLLLHNVTADTCVAMNQWVQNPTSHTALDDILPCVDNATSQETLTRSKEVTSQLVDLTNLFISNVSDVNFSPSFALFYYNQSGPLLPTLCNPFHHDLTPRNCSHGEVDLNNATQVWKNYVCDVSTTTGYCITTGRLTPKYYSQVAAAVNVSYGLYNYGPFLIDLQDCTFARQTFTDIYQNHCPGLRRFSKWVYVGLFTVSMSVMLSLLFWVIYGRERKHRVYTKHVMEGGYK
ncbi:hypothetical protein Droror1_Dr00002767 [Drosera rotundifolia]